MISLTYNGVGSPLKFSPAFATQLPFKSLNTPPGPDVREVVPVTTVKLVVAVGDVPPLLLATAVTVCGPVGKVIPEQDQAPLVLAVVVQMVVPFSPTVTLAPGVAVPVIVGVVVAVVPVAGLTIAIVGGPATVKEVEAGVDGPPSLLATAVTLCGPVGKVTEQDQAPLVLAVVVQSVFPFSPTVTLEPGVAVPVMTGVVVVVVPVAGPVIAMVGGATTENDVVAVGDVPDALLATAVKVCGPAGNGAGFGQLQVPDAVAVVVQIVEPPSPTVTLAPGVVVPLMVGVIVVFVPFAGLVKPIVGGMPHKPPGVV